MGIGLAYAFVMCLMFIFCIRQRDIRKKQNLVLKFKAIKCSNLKINIYILIMTFIVFVVTVILFIAFPDNTNIQNIRSITLISLLVVAAYYDWLEYRIPNKLIGLGIILWIIITIFEAILMNNIWIRNLILEVIVSVAFLIVCILCMIIVKNGLGMGDVKLLILIGLLEGMDGAISSLFISMLIIFTVSIVLIIAKKKSKTDMLPFAPYILIGTIISICTSGY